MIDWTECQDVEIIPGRVSGKPVIKMTRLPVEAILANADDFTPEEIATEIFEGITPEIVRRVIAFAKAHNLPTQ